jgi:hypothetical protein
MLVDARDGLISNARVFSSGRKDLPNPMPSGKDILRSLKNGSAQDDAAVVVV